VLEILNKFVTKNLLIARLDFYIENILSHGLYKVENNTQTSEFYKTRPEVTSQRKYFFLIELKVRNKFIIQICLIACLIYFIQNVLSQNRL
jgi:hypothetical protein